MEEKIRQMKKIFMHESYIDMWNVYERTLKNEAIAKWDWIILTASNEEQANTYRIEIDARLKNGNLPSYTKYAVISDPEGKRVGSGGATLNVLRYIKENSLEKDAFSGKKILIIHSGGDSKRIPQYSACGKLFSPVQRQLPDGRCSTLFDEFMIAFATVPSKMTDGVLLLSGDVLLVFNPLQIDLQYVDCAAISIKAPAETGKNHGVFLSDENKNIKEFLHKQNIENLKKMGAINSNNYVDIDTGAVFFSSEIVHKLFNLISLNGELNEKKFSEFVNDKVRISLYGDFVYALAQNSNLDEYYKQVPEGEFSEELKLCRKKIWDKLNEYVLRIIRLSPAEFIHFGTTKELLELTTTKLNEYSYIGWTNKVLTNINNNSKYSVYKSYINKKAVISNNVYIENSNILEHANIGDNVIISNTEINGKIPDNMVISTLPIRNNKYVTRIYSQFDNPKTKKTENTKFMNTIFENMLEKYKIDEDEIWDKNDEKDIWNAKLYSVCDSMKSSVDSALKLYNILNCNESEVFVEAWLKTKRESLKSSFNLCDTEKMKKLNDELEIKIRTQNFINGVKEQEETDKLKDIIIKSPNTQAQINNVINNLEKLDYPIKYRSFLIISEILKEKKDIKLSAEYFENLCYENIKKMVQKGFGDYTEIKATKSKVIVELPIRVNFAGGWSDTPPYCFENGGTVLNVALMLNNKKPIKVSVEKTGTESIVLQSIDLNIKKEFYDIEELKQCSNTNDPFSLPKASLLVTGIIRDEDKDISSVINRLKGGIILTTDASFVPKGSGLGTSSILSGACLKALYDFINVDITDEELCYKTLEQEQFMSTGGGWQDQIGGLIPGVKIIKTKPGRIQQFEIEKLKLSDTTINELNNRLVLIFTGQRRLAKNLLRDIMSKYILRDENTIKVIEEIKRLPTLMQKELENANIDEFANMLNKHWKLSKKLDKGCTNTFINQILVSCEDLIEGKMICGAGGGGFLQVILKKGITKEQLANRIESIFQDTDIKVWDCNIVN